MNCLPHPISMRFDRLPPCSRRSGFSLIELLLVLMLMTVVLTVAGLNYSGIWRHQQKQDTAEHMLTLMHSARQYAMATGKPYRLNVDAENKKYWLTTLDNASGEFVKPKHRPNERFDIPKSVELTWEKPESLVEKQYIVFYPDGTTQATCLTFIDADENAVSLYNETLTTQFQIGQPSAEAIYEEDEKAAPIN